MLSNSALRAGAPLAVLLASIALAVPARAQAVEYFNYSAFTAGVGPLTIVGFDDIPAGNGGLSSTQYASLGLTVVQRDGVAMNVMNFGSNSLFPMANFNSLPNVISSADGVAGFDCPPCSDNFDFILSPPRKAAGIWIGNIHTTEVQFLDASGAVLAKESFTTSSPGIISGGGPIWNNRIFYGVVSSTPVATIRTVEPCCDGDGICYDDVQWGDVPGVAIYGTSTPGCAGALAIGMNSTPKLGNLGFAVTCSNAPVSTPGFFGLSSGALGAPLAIVGVSIWIDPSSVLVFHAASNAAGAAAVGVPIQNAAALVGVQVSTQFLFPSACGPQGLCASNAATFTVQP